MTRRLPRLVVLREVLTRTPSGAHVVHSSIHVKFWAESVPPVEAVRPGRCPGCGAASRPLGKALVLVGHGLRERQVRGPARAGEPPELRVISVRRYRCRRCHAVCTVVPRGVVRRRHFGAGAIGWALFLFGVEQRTSRQIRDQVGGLGSAEAGYWITFGRWLAAAAQGALFPTRAAPVLASTRGGAEQIAMTLVSFAPPELASSPLGEQAFAGAEVIARAA